MQYCVGSLTACRMRRMPSTNYAPELDWTETRRHSRHEPRKCSLGDDWRLLYAWRYKHTRQTESHARRIQHVRKATSPRVTSYDPHDEDNKTVYGPA